MSSRINHPASYIRSGLYSRRAVLFAVLVSVIYELLSLLLIGFRMEQLILIGLFNLLYFLSPPTRKFILAFSVFIIYWIIFDYMKAFPNYRYHAVHIESLYHAEKSFFGIQVNGKLL